LNIKLKKSDTKIYNKFFIVLYGNIIKIYMNLEFPLSDNDINDNLCKYDRIIHLSDIHIRMNERHEEYRKCFEELYNKLELYDKSTSIIVITGDILNERTGISAETIILCTEFLKRLSSILRTILIAGNHDGYLNSSQKIDIISGILYDKNIFNLYYLKYSGIYTFKNLTFGVSSIFEDKFIKAEDIPNIPDINQIKVALYHGSVGNTKLQNLMISKGERTVEDFDGYDYVLLGDIHHYQYLNESNTIAYASSLICQTYGEIGDHGYILWDLKNKKSDYIKIHNEYDFKSGYLMSDKLKIDDIIFDISDIECIKEYLPNRCRLQIYREDILDNRDKIKYLKNKLKNISIKERDDIIVKKNDKEIRLKYNIDVKEIIRELLLNKYKDVEEEIIIWIEEQLINNDKIINNEYNTCEFLKLKFSNLFIYGDNNEIDMLKYNTKDIILICGKNSYGKSSLIDIIIFNLYDEYARDIGNIKKSKSVILNNNNNEGFSELLIRIGDIMYLIKKNYKRKKEEIETIGFLYRLDDINDITIVHKNHKMNTNLLYEYNGTKYKLTAYLSGKSITKEIERLLGKKDNFMLINIMMQNDNISFKNKNQTERKKTLMQLLNLDKYEKIKKDVSSKYLEEKIKKDKLINLTIDIDIINLKEESKKKELEIEMIKDRIHNYNKKMDFLLNKKEYLLLDYSKIDDNLINNESLIKKDIEKILNENINFENEITKIRLLFTETSENYEIIKLQDSCEFEELNTYLRQKLIDKKALYETKNTIDNIDIELNNLEFKINNINEEENVYIKMKENKYNINKEYNYKKDISNKILNVLEYEKNKIIIIDNKIDKINTLEELYILKENKRIIINNDKKDIEIIINKLEYIENTIIKLNDSIKKDDDINELYLKNENNKRELEKLNDEITIKTELLNELETHEYNKECVQCMKNPKVKNMFKINEDIKVLNKRILLINIDKNIIRRKEIYEINKIELNKYYENINDKSNKLKILNNNIVKNENNLLDIDNKIKLIEIINKILLEKNNLDVNKLTQEINNINDNMQNIFKRIESKKYLESELKDLEIDKILIIKNIDIIRKNDIINNDIIKIEIKIKELKSKMEIDIYRNTKKESIKGIENEKRINIKLLNKLYNELSEINIHKINIDNNKLIKIRKDEIDIEVKEINKYNLIFEKDLTRNEIENNYLQIKINNYKDNLKEIMDNEPIYKKWKYYNDIVDKNGLPLYIINKYLEIITDGINKIIGPILNKKIKLYEMSDNIIINIYDHDNKIVDFIGGMETFILDISFKITLSKIMELSKCNFLFIDEGISSFDKDNLTNIEELFYFLNQHFDYIFIMSHIEQIKDYVSQKIIIKNEYGYSKITF
jgi:DNA repair exonuclease SbcCD ATPase subunit